MAFRSSMFSICAAFGSISIVITTRCNLKSNNSDQSVKSYQFCHHNATYVG
jgi:hypothetical protein